MRGKAWKYGDNIDTDAIIPARYLASSDPEYLAGHCMEDAGGDFVIKARPGDFIVAENNFGCGSSREHAPIAIKGSQAKCIIARSYARIFFRNAINIGLPIFECPEAVDDIEEGNQVDIDIASGVIENKTKGQTYQANALPEFVLKIAQAGGIIPFLKDHTIDELIV